MKISELLSEQELIELFEGYVYRRQLKISPLQIRRPVRRIVNKSPKARLPTIRPDLKAVKQPITSKSQTTGLNPKIDPINGFNFRLNQTNVKPEFTDKEIEIEMKSRNNNKRSF